MYLSKNSATYTTYVLLPLSPRMCVVGWVHQVLKGVKAYALMARVAHDPKWSHLLLRMVLQKWQVNFRSSQHTEAMRAFAATHKASAVWLLGNVMGHWMKQELLGYIFQWRHASISSPEAWKAAFSPSAAAVSTDISYAVSLRTIGLQMSARILGRMIQGVMLRGLAVWSQQAGVTRHNAEHMLVTTRHLRQQLDATGLHRILHSWIRTI